MEKDFRSTNWQTYIPQPVCEQFPEYQAFYQTTWNILREHIKEIEGLPQSPYMDEAFCDTQIWIWDSCFMSLVCKFAQQVFPGIETLKNFYQALYGNQPLPSVIPTEKEPWWTGAKPNEPFVIKVHIADNPPLFAWAEYENALFSGDIQHVKELLYEKQFLQRHYAWLEGLKEKKKLDGVHCTVHWLAEENGYKWECGASGMDNTPRGRTRTPAEKERPNNPDMLWIDAICQQALSARSISRLFALVGDSQNAKAWEKKYIQKKDIVNRLYWDEKDGFYYDIDCKDNHFYKVQTIAAYWTLTSGIAPKEAAKRLVDLTLSPKHFGGEVPLVSLARGDVDFVSNGKYWRGSLWLPTAYATLKGMAEYGFLQEAQSTAYNVFKHMLETYQTYQPHTVWEAYSPNEPKPATKPDGKTTVRKDFCGWSALGPISIYLEYVLGFHSVNAFERVVKWAKPTMFKGKVGVKNLRFGDIVTDIVAKGNRCKVKSNAPYCLQIDGKSFAIHTGVNEFAMDDELRGGENK